MTVDDAVRKVEGYTMEAQPVKADQQNDQPSNVVHQSVSTSTTSGSQDLQSTPEVPAESSTTSEHQDVKNLSQQQTSENTDTSIGKKIMKSLTYKIQGLGSTYGKLSEKTASTTIVSGDRSVDLESIPESSKVNRVPKSIKFIAEKDSKIPSEQETMSEELTDTDESSNAQASSAVNSQSIPSFQKTEANTARKETTNSDSCMSILISVEHAMEIEKVTQFCTEISKINTRIIILVDDLTALLQKIRSSNKHRICAWPSAVANVHRLKNLAEHKMPEVITKTKTAAKKVHNSNVVFENRKKFLIRICVKICEVVESLLEDFKQFIQSMEQPMDEDSSNLRIQLRYSIGELTSLIMDLQPKITGFKRVRITPNKQYPFNQEEMCVVDPVDNVNPEIEIIGLGSSNELPRVTKKPNFVTIGLISCCILLVVSIVVLVKKQQNQIQYLADKFNVTQLD